MKKLIFATIAVLIISGSATPHAFATPDAAVIAADCVAAQSIMSQLEKVDAVTRINRGREYTNTLNLLFAMNARLSANRVVAPKLAEITANFSDGVGGFRADYDHYDDTLTNAIDVNCVANTGEFYGRLETARAARAKVSDDIANLDQLINNYRDELNAVIGGIK